MCLHRSNQYSRAALRCLLFPTNISPHVWCFSFVVTFSPVSHSSDASPPTFSVASVASNCLLISPSSPSVLFFLVACVCTLLSTLGLAPVSCSCQLLEVADETLNSSMPSPDRFTRPWWLCPSLGVCVSPDSDLLWAAVFSSSSTWGVCSLTFRIEMIESYPRSIIGTNLSLKVETIEELH